MRDNFDLRIIYKNQFFLQLFFLTYHLPTLIEAKSTTGNTKSSKQIMKNPNHYGKTKLIKIGDYNISESGDVITIPHYLAFALGREL